MGGGEKPTGSHEGGGDVKRPGVDRAKAREAVSHGARDKRRGSSQDSVSGLLEVREEMSVKDFLKLSREERFKYIFGVDSDSIGPGSTLTANFHGNKKLERKIGLHHLVPEGVKFLEKEGKRYRRKGKLGSFYRWGRYLSIFQGTQVVVSVKEEKAPAPRRAASRAPEKVAPKKAVPKRGRGMVAEQKPLAESPTESQDYMPIDRVISYYPEIGDSMGRIRRQRLEVRDTTDPMLHLQIPEGFDPSKPVEWIFVIHGAPGGKKNEELYNMYIGPDGRSRVIPNVKHPNQVVVTVSNWTRIKSWKQDTQLSIPMMEEYATRALLAGSDGREQLSASLDGGGEAVAPDQAEIESRTVGLWGHSFGGHVLVKNMDTLVSNATPENPVRLVFNDTVDWANRVKLTKLIPALVDGKLELIISVRKNNDESTKALLQELARMGLADQSDVDSLSYDRAELPNLLIVNSWKVPQSDRAAYAARISADDQRGLAASRQVTRGNIGHAPLKYLSAYMTDRMDGRGAPAGAPAPEGDMVAEVERDEAGVETVSYDGNAASGELQVGDLDFAFDGQDVPGDREEIRAYVEDAIAESAKKAPSKQRELYVERMTAYMEYSGKYFLNTACVDAAVQLFERTLPPESLPYAHIKASIDYDLADIAAEDKRGVEWVNTPERFAEVLTIVSPDVNRALAFGWDATQPLFVTKYSKDGSNPRRGYLLIPIVRGQAMNVTTGENMRVLEMPVTTGAAGVAKGTKRGSKETPFGVHRLSAEQGYLREGRGFRYRGTRAPVAFALMEGMEDPQAHTGIVGNRESAPRAIGLHGSDIKRHSPRLGEAQYGGLGCTRVRNLALNNLMVPLLKEYGNIWMVSGTDDLDDYSDTPGGDELVASR